MKKMERVDTLASLEVSTPCRALSFGEVWSIMGNGGIWYDADFTADYYIAICS